MNAKMKILFFIVVLLVLLPLKICHASIFTMNLKHDSIYTPGEINLTMQLNEKAKFNGGYKYKISFFLTGTLIREQTLEASRENPVNLKFSIPEVFDKTKGTCRCELFIGEDFLEAQEFPLLVWPAIQPYKQETSMNTQIWVYDTSGKLLELFTKMKVKVIDATFKSARDFSKPDIVFIGENTDPNNMKIIAESIANVTLKPVVIYLKQTQFPKENKIDIPADSNTGHSITIAKDNGFLLDLSLSDIHSMIQNSTCLKIKKDENSRRNVQSYINEESQDIEEICSYLCTEKKDSQVMIYCQLPIT